MGLQITIKEIQYNLLVSDHSMMRKLLPLLTRSLPRIGRTFVLGTMLLVHHRYFNKLTPLCAFESSSSSESISDIESQIVRIECNGDLVGYAFCFSDGLLVTASLDHSESINGRKTYEFFLGDDKLSGSFQVVGNYENLSFIEYKLSDRIKPLPAQPSTDQPTISEVQILQKREFLSIRNAYMVGEDSGYGIVDGRGEVGSLVLRGGRAIGVVVQVGRESESGFLRIIQWKYLQKLFNHSQGHKLQLGLSAKSCEDQQGIAIIRIAPNSPFHNSLQMGDIVLRANNQKIRTPESLLKISIMSSGPIQLVVLRDGAKIAVSTQL